MAEDLYCFDTSVVVMALTAEEPAESSARAARLLERAVSSGRLVAPAWAWAETGSALRKKVRQRLLSEDQAESLWRSFCQLPIEYLHSPELVARSWEIAWRYNLLTLYDASFLACIEIQALDGVTRAEYWTADARLIQDFGSAVPPYVHVIGDFRDG
jgi:predicted nucleic acid-binding protein